MFNSAIRNPERLAAVAPQAPDENVGECKEEASRLVLKSPKRFKSSTGGDTSVAKSKEKNSDHNTSDEDSALKKKNLRRKHSNSHLGCGTCKKRRIKCDEMLPQCFNCVKGKLHCAYLNLDAPARNALRMAQYNQYLRGDPPEELMSYYKEYSSDAHSAPHAPQQLMQPINVQQTMAVHQDGASASSGAVSAGTIPQLAEYFSSGYLPYQMVPQVVNNAQPTGAGTASCIMQPMYRSMVRIQQPDPAKALVIYQQVPYHMVSAAQMPQMMYQSQEQLALHMAHKPGQVHMAPVGSMDGLPVMIINGPPDNITYDNNTVTALNTVGGGPAASAASMISTGLAQIPRLYPHGMAPVLVAPGVSQSPIGQQISPGMAQISPAIPYHTVGPLQQPSPVPQIAQTPQLLQYHQIPSISLMAPVMQAQNAPTASPMVKAMLTPLGASYYLTPLMLAASIPGTYGTLEQQRRNLSVKVKSEFGKDDFVKSEFASEFEHQGSRHHEKKVYSADSPESITGSEKVPSIKMLLS